MEKRQVHIKDWRTNDNIIIVTNIINKQLLKENFAAKLVTPQDVLKKVVKLKKFNGCSLYEASELYKKMIKDQYNLL